MVLRPISALTAGAAGVLFLAAPRPVAALRTLHSAATATDPSAPLLALVALLAWALLGWLLVIAAATLAAKLPGLAGKVGAAVATRVAPVSLRRVVEVALGLTVAAGVLGASPASASPDLPPAPPAASASFDWPSAPAGPEWNPPIAPAPVAARPAAPAPVDAAVVIRPGDSLWSVAADHLPAAASDAEIAQAWPTWWAANRDAVGADPDLIQPGLHLTPPATH